MNIPDFCFILFNLEIFGKIITARDVFRGGIVPWVPPLGRQYSIISIEKHIKLRHAPPPPPL